MRFSCTAPCCGAPVAAPRHYLLLLALGPRLLSGQDVPAGPTEPLAAAAAVLSLSAEEAAGACA